ncbi:GRIP and coiled-coil domain-containing protein 2-like [Uloborus diversus]|uniref:GRIP and coiled-coil domain-containing protein 2-like n=1 Tax=Uloborus diversus TaxID=327109 RepID=UPI00240A62F2|nr:GRIP and coiled-coil domain-containing protein 2-like [Uloborus diversus]
MAEVLAGSDISEQKKKNILEEKSHEDLVKIVKKQLTLLQKAKAKSDELNAKCQQLDQEKNSIAVDYEENEKKLSDEISLLKSNNLKLLEEKKKYEHDKEMEISDLHRELEEITSEKNKYFIQSRDCQEQVQCLTMQLDTLKATCQCLQGELQKLQSSNKDICDENAVLVSARDSALQSLKEAKLHLDNKSKVHEQCVDEFEELKKKYMICFDENCSLRSNVKSLEAKVENVEVENMKLTKNIKEMEADFSSKLAEKNVTDDSNDFSVLIMDNQKLREQVDFLKSEIDEHKQDHNEHRHSLEDQKEFIEIKKENSQLQKALIDLESSVKELRTANKDLEEKNKNILLELESLKTKHSDTLCLINTNADEKQKLESEIQRLTVLLEQNSFRGDFEHALLYGAPTDSLVNIDRKSEQINALLEGKDTSTSAENSLKCNKVVDMNEFGISEPSPGFEMAVLEGGDVGQLFPSEYVQNENFLPSERRKKEPILMIELGDNFYMTKEEIKDLLFKHEELQKEYDVISREFNFMTAKLDTCSSLLQETLEQNEELKLKLSPEMKLDIIESTYSIGASVGDEFQKKISSDEHGAFVDKLVESGDAFYNSDVGEMKVSDNVEYQTIVPENNKANKKIDELPEALSELAKFNTELKEKCEIIEKHNSELSEKFDKKCAELNDFNLQLELLVIAIKQGVRQKISTTYRTENELTENMNLLKSLLDDLVSRSNNNALKLKTMESDLDDVVAQKSSLEEELIQLKELNQFLEDEALELKDEVEQLKSNLKEIGNPEMLHKKYETSSELYSIEEDNELEDKIVVSDAPLDNDADNENVSSVTTENILPYGNKSLCNASTEVCIVLNDLATQTDSYSEMKNVDTEDALNEDVLDDKLSPKKLLEENIVLKDTICDKSKLVERIHCEMDSLLTKVEELTNELQEKEDDLNAVSCKRSDLERTLNKYCCIEEQRMTALKTISEAICSLKITNVELSSEIKAFFSAFNETVNELNKRIADVINFISSKTVDLETECSHAAAHFSTVKESVSSTTSDFELWINFLNTSINSCMDSSRMENNELDKLTKTFLNSISIEQECLNHLCCTISNDMQHFQTTKNKLLSEIHNYCTVINDSVIKELSEYKLKVVPSLENMVKTLENKLMECSNISNAADDESQKSMDENASTESLKKQLEETETKMNKFKQIALKLKKETASFKKQCEEMEADKQKTLKDVNNLQQEVLKLSTENYEYLQNYQSLQNEYDKLQDEFDVKVVHNKKIEDDYANLLVQHNAGKEQINELDLELKKLKERLETITLFKHEMEAKQAELESKVIVLDTANQEKIKRIQDLEEEAQKKMIDFKSTVDENKALKEKLELAQKEGKKKNLLDLEMADYEKSITELNNQIHKKDNEIVELQNDIKCLLEKNSALQEEIKSTEMLKKTEEERAVNLKDMLEKIKVDLMSVREHETELLGQNSSLQIQLEIMTQKEENYKLHLSETSIEAQNLKESIKMSAENHQRIVKSLESKIATQKQEILIAHKEVESVKQEFENYKIRVHSVLKQQKNTTPGITSIEADLKEKLETMNEKLKLQIKDLSEKSTALTLEYETLQEEHDNLLQRYNKILDEREKKDLEWQHRLDQVTAEKNRIAAAQEELSSQHLLQNEMLVATYKKQIKIMSEEHKRTISDLQKQLDTADIEISRLQREQQKPYGAPSTPSVPDNNVPFDIFSQERQEGEGSESTDEITTPVRQLSLATIPTSGFLPFDKLLQSQLEPGTPASLASTHDSEKLLTDLNAANKKIDHLSELLNDSESANLRFGEQIRVLKEEVRRLERNKEREQHAENLEYLKNVFIKFSTLQPCSEKAMLIPVLTTMLKLSPNEQQQLKEIAGDVDPAESASSGWGSYLHRWSGLA